MKNNIYFKNIESTYFKNYQTNTYVKNLENKKKMIESIMDQIL